MFERRPYVGAFRELMVAACLLILAGCLPNTKPAAPVPANLTATAGAGQVTLVWAASTGATGYNVKRGTASGGPYTKLASPTTPTYTDTTVTNGTTYYYVVSSLNPAGESVNSVEVSATPKSEPPPVPTNLTATAGNAMVNVSWSASTTATGYNLKRATISGGPYTQIASPTNTTYVDTTVTNGTTYYYVVSAVNSVGESANSTEVSALPSIPPPTAFGTWTDVTPSGVNLTSTLDCGNFGAATVQADPANPSNLYTEFNCQGIWKSTDYGLTWNGPINTGTNGATVADCSGGISISPYSAASVPTLYEACFRGSATGFWISNDGGVNWTSHIVAATTRQDYYPPVFDPYDANHFLMAGHEFDSIVESVDGGQTWTSVPLAAGMLQNGGTGFVFFINTGTAVTTRGTWLWLGQQTGGMYGTWRTTNGGTAWVQVDKNEHPIGAEQIYQPNGGAVIYMAGAYSALGWGTLRSSDYGQTWTHVGMTDNEAVAFGTSKNVYAMFGFPQGPGGAAIKPAFEVAAQPGNGTWVEPDTLTGLAYGSSQIAVVNDGTNNIFVGAMWNSGVWRYVEP